MSKRSFAAMSALSLPQAPDARPQRPYDFEAERTLESTTLPDGDKAAWFLQTGRTVWFVEFMRDHPKTEVPVESAGAARAFAQALAISAGTGQALQPACVKLRVGPGFDAEAAGAIATAAGQYPRAFEHVDLEISTADSAVQPHVATVAIALAAVGALSCRVSFTHDAEARGAEMWNGIASGLPGLAEKVTVTQAQAFDAAAVEVLGSSRTPEKKAEWLLANDRPQLFAEFLDTNPTTLILIRDSASAATLARAMAVSRARNAAFDPQGNRIVRLDFVPGMDEGTAKSVAECIALQPKFFQKLHVNVGADTIEPLAIVMKALASLTWHANFPSLDEFAWGVIEGVCVQGVTEGILHVCGNFPRTRTFVMKCFAVPDDACWDALKKNAEFARIEVLNVEIGPTTAGLEKLSPLVVTPCIHLQFDSGFNQRVPVTLMDALCKSGAHAIEWMGGFALDDALDLLEHATSTRLILRPSADWVADCTDAAMKALAKPSLRHLVLPGCVDLARIAELLEKSSLEALFLHRATIPPGDEPWQRVRRAIVRCERLSNLSFRRERSVDQRLTTQQRVQLMKIAGRRVFLQAQLTGDISGDFARAVTEGFLAAFSQARALLGNNAVPPEVAVPLGGHLTVESAGRLAGVSRLAYRAGRNWIEAYAKKSARAPQTYVRLFGQPWPNAAQIESFFRHAAASKYLRETMTGALMVLEALPMFLESGVEPSVLVAFFARCVMAKTLTAAAVRKELVRVNAPAPIRSGFESRLSDRLLQSGDASISACGDLQLSPQFLVGSLVRGAAQVSDPAFRLQWVQYPKHVVPEWHVPVLEVLAKVDPGSADERACLDVMRDIAWWQAWAIPPVLEALEKMGRPELTRAFQQAVCDKALALNTPLWIPYAIPFGCLVDSVMRGCVTSAINLARQVHSYPHEQRNAIGLELVEGLARADAACDPGKVEALMSLLAAAVIGEMLHWPDVATALLERHLADLASLLQQQVCEQVLESHRRDVIKGLADTYLFETLAMPFSRVMDAWHAKPDLLESAFFWQQLKGYPLETREAFLNALPRLCVERGLRPALLKDALLGYRTAVYKTDPLFEDFDKHGIDARRLIAAARGERECVEEIYRLLKPRAGGRTKNGYAKLVNLKDSTVAHADRADMLAVRFYGTLGIVVAPATDVAAVRVLRDKLYDQYFPG
jgi:hypothetical protein